MENECKDRATWIRASDPKGVMESNVISPVIKDKLLNTVNCWFSHFGVQELDHILGQFAQICKWFKSRN